MQGVGRAAVFNGRGTWHRADGRLGCVRNADCLRGSRGVAAEVGRRPGAHMHHRAGPAAAVHIGQRGCAARIRAVGVAKTGTAGHSMVVGPGTALMVGLVVSANGDGLRGSRGVAAEVGCRPGAHMHRRAGPAAAVHIGQSRRAARIRSRRCGEYRQRRGFEWSRDLAPR